MIELKKEVRLDGSIDLPQTINKIVFKDGREVYYSEFIKKYTEYTDPKDLEITRLLGVIEELEKAGKPTRKRRRTLTAGEIKEIRVLIHLNTDINEIAKEYESSTSAIYRIKKIMIEEAIKNGDQ